MTVEVEVKFEGIYSEVSTVRAAQMVEREIESYIPRTGIEFTEARVAKNEAVVTQ